MKVDSKLLKEVDFEKGGGLLPVVVQDATTGQVLMQAYVNREALEKTLQTGYAHYYSRSRKKLWKKGETSGNVQLVKEVKLDCDGDSLLYLVEQKGNACHTGAYSCFYRTLAEDGSAEPNPVAVLKELYHLIEQRKKELPEGSYTASLFKSGEDRILQKVGEESVETILAMKSGKKEEAVYETADLLYHLLVALVDKGITLEEVARELKRRMR